MNETHYIKIPDKIDFDNVVFIRKQGEQQMREKSKIQIDFSVIKYYDSSLLALLVAWKRFAKKNNIAIDFIEVPPSLKILAKICDVHTLLEI